jgi:hypothetical protein
MPSADIFLHKRNLRREYYYATIVAKYALPIDRKGIFFFVKHEKKGRCFFQQLKNGMHRSFMHYKEIYYINIHKLFTNVSC